MTRVREANSPAYRSMSRAVDRGRRGDEPPCSPTPLMGSSRLSSRLFTVQDCASRLRHLPGDRVPRRWNPAVPPDPRRRRARGRERGDPLRPHRLLFPAERGIPAGDGSLRGRARGRGAASAGRAARARPGRRRARGGVAGAGGAPVRGLAVPGPLRDLAGVDRRRRVRRRRHRCDAAAAGPCPQAARGGGIAATRVRRSSRAGHGRAVDRRAADRADRARAAALAAVGRAPAGRPEVRRPADPPLDRMAP